MLTSDKEDYVLVTLSYSHISGLKRSGRSVDSRTGASDRSSLVYILVASVMDLWLVERVTRRVAVGDREPIADPRCDICFQ